ncbi:MAG: DUF7507 domain-containing protein [Armatimonadota bacterium]
MKITHVMPVLLMLALIAGFFAIAPQAVFGAQIGMAKETEQHPGDPVHPVNVYLVGQEVHYDLAITNTSPTEAMTIDIFDIEPGGSPSVQVGDDVTLDPGETWNDDYHYFVDAGDLVFISGAWRIVNRLSAVGVQGEDLVDASVTKTSRVVQPSVSVTKEADTEISKAGDPVNYTITITNTGDWPLENISVVDSLLGDLSAHFTSPLAAGAQSTYVYEYIVQVGDDDPLVNEVTVTAVAQGFSEEIEGAVVTDSAADSVDLVHPGIAIEKTADASVVHVGDTVNYTIEVFNTGDVELIDVAVTDSLAAASPWAAIPSILPGESAVLNFSYVVQEGDASPLVNTATATGYLEHLPNVIGPVEDSAEVTIIRPALSIEKTVDFNGDEVYSDAETNYAGQDAAWKIVVTNTGDSTVYNVYVNDTNGQAYGPVTLAPGESATFDYTSTVNADTVNTATAEGMDELDATVGPVSDDAEVDVISPALSIAKTVDFNGDDVFTDSELYYAGQPADWKIVVTNTGDSPLTNVTVTDTNGESFGPVDLAPGETATFDYTTTVNAGTVNTATAQGEDELGNPVGPVEDSAEVSVISPALSIQKTVDFDGDDVYTDSETNTAGQNADWKIVVSNTGDSTVYDVYVSDTNGQAYGPVTLAPGESVTYDYTTTVNEDTVNTATAQGTDELGNPVGPVSDSAEVTVFVQETECFSETAWAAQSQPGQTRFVPAPGDWATYVHYEVGQGTVEDPAVFPLYAGQTHLSGYLYVYDEGNSLYVRYVTLDGDSNPPYKPGYCGSWSGLTEYHLEVVGTVSGFNPVRTYNKKKNQYGGPIPGAFRYKASYDEKTPDTGWIAADIAGFSNDIYIAAHGVMWWCGSPCE